MSSLKQVVGGTVASRRPARTSVVVRAGAYDEELIATAKKIASPGRYVCWEHACCLTVDLHGAHVPTGRSCPSSAVYSAPPTAFVLH